METRSRKKQSLILKRMRAYVREDSRAYTRAMLRTECAHERHTLPEWADFKASIHYLWSERTKSRTLFKR